MKKEDCPVYYGDCKNCICFIDNQCRHNHEDYQGFCYQCQKVLKTGVKYCSKECKLRHKEDILKEQKEMEEQIKKDGAVLEEAKKHLTKKQIEIFEADLKDLEYIWGCKFVDKPKGENQRNPYYEEWVNQRTVGDSGDCFTGEVYIKLSNGKYLEYSYDC